MTTIRAAVEIDAPIDTVYRIMVDFPRYGEWNPFVFAIAGDARVGASLTLSVQLAKGLRTRVREVIEVIGAAGDRAELTYRFTGIVATLNLVRARRSQVLTRLPGGATRYETEEAFTGILTFLLPKRLLERGFSTHAAALKRRAEQGVSA